MQSFRQYITFKKDYHGLLLVLLRELVNNAMRFEEILSGSTSGLSYVDVQVADLQAKVLKLTGFSLVMVMDL